MGRFGQIIPACHRLPPPTGPVVSAKRGEAVPMPFKGDSNVVPSGYSRIDPWVISRDTDAEIEFMRRAFGAEERPNSRVLNADGTIGHVEVGLVDSVVMMFDAQPGWPDLPAHLRV